MTTLIFSLSLVFISLCILFVIRMLSVRVGWNILDKGCIFLFIFICSYFSSLVFFLHNNSHSFLAVTLLTALNVSVFVCYMGMFMIEGDPVSNASFIGWIVCNGKVTFSKSITPRRDQFWKRFFSWGRVINGYEKVYLKESLMRKTVLVTGMFSFEATEETNVATFEKMTEQCIKEIRTTLRKSKISGENSRETAWMIDDILKEWSNKMDCYVSFTNGRFKQGAKGYGLFDIRYSGGNSK